MNRNSFLKFVFCLMAMLISKLGGSYPSYIGYGYSSCLTCHSNPLGNGPINNYGRAVQASEISGRLFGGTDESLGEKSGFIFPLPSWLQVQASYRGIYVGQSLQSSPQYRWIHMQADGAAIVTFSKQLFASASAGYVPLPASLSESQKASLSHIISREHYLGLRPAKGHGIYAGLMDVAFGLRVPDHNAFLRANTLLNMNDQTHGLLYHYDWEQGELALHFFLGKLNQDSASRQKGGTLYSEFLVDENFRLGGSLWYSESSFRSRQMLATHMRMQAGKGSSLLAEVGIFRQSLSSSTDSSIGLFSFLQSRHLFFRGFAGLMTFEAYLDRFAEGGIRTFRAGPSLEYLPFPQCEIRADFLGSQNQGLNTVAPNSYLLQVQTHVWL